jgi:hypothetical protein
MSADIYNQIIQKIVRKQETIIGPIAVEQARRVPNLHLNWDKHEVTIRGDGTKVIDELVKQYETLFGKTSVEVCKEAAGSLVSTLPTKEVPSLLR